MTESGFTDDMDAPPDVGPSTEGLLAAPKSRPGLGKTYSTIMYGCPEAMHLFTNSPTGHERSTPEPSNRP